MVIRSSNGNKVSIVIVILIISFFIPTSNRFAAVFNVTNEDQLRQALDMAASNGEDDAINIAAGIYNTSEETFTYSTNEGFSLTIQGVGDGLTILDGGGLFANAQTKLNLSGNLFSGNSAGFSGGGALITAPDLIMSDNEFTGNSSLSSSGGGARIENTIPVPIIWLLTNNIFNGNSSATVGGGLQIEVLSAGDGGSNVTLTNNTFTLNKAENDGGGIAISLSALSSFPPLPTLRFVLDVYNNIIFNNFSVGGADDIDIKSTGFGNILLSVNLFNNDFSNFLIDCSASCSPEINEGNNIDEHPLFVNAEVGDVSLQPNSPCIDAGDPNAPDVPSTDFFGYRRIPPPDLGGVEFIPPTVADLHGGGGGCSIVHTPVTSSLAVFIAIPALIMIRRIVKRYRS